MIRLMLNGSFLTNVSPKIIPRIGEKVTAGFLPGLCVVTDIVHDVGHNVISIYLEAI